MIDVCRLHLVPFLTRVVKETSTQNEDAHTPKPSEARPGEGDKAAICAHLVRDCLDSGAEALTCSC